MENSLLYQQKEQKNEMIDILTQKHQNQDIIEEQTKLDFLQSKHQVSDYKNKRQQQNDSQTSQNELQKWSKKEILKYLKSKNWNIQTFQETHQWKILSKQEQEGFKETCDLEILFKKLQNWVKELPNRTVDEGIQLQQFQRLNVFPKMKKYKNNQNHYRKKKQQSQKNNMDTENQQNLSQQSIILQARINEQNAILEEMPLQTLYQNSIQEVKINDFIDKSRKEWFTLIQQCMKSSFTERGFLMKTFYHKDPIVFIDRLNEYFIENELQNLFSTLLNLIINGEQKLLRVSLFQVACKFYNNELLHDCHKQLIKEQLLTSVILRINNEQDNNASLGLLQLLFANQLDITIDHQRLLTDMINHCSLAFKTFLLKLIQQPFGFREEIVGRFPKSGFLFNKGFLNYLHDDKGLDFLKFCDSSRELFICQIVYSHDSDRSAIKEYIQYISSQLQDYDFQLNKGQLQEFIGKLVINLKQQDSIWIGNLRSQQALIMKIINGIIEKKVQYATKFLQCLQGDFSLLNFELTKSVIIETNSIKNIQNLIQEFKDLNQNQSHVQTYNTFNFSVDVKLVLKQIEETYGRQFHDLQNICLQFILRNVSSKNIFLHLGTGTGKSLLSTSIAILINSFLKKSVVIVVKSDYLLYRDFKNFKQIIEKCGQMAAHQTFLQNGITFLDEKNFFTMIKNYQKKIVENIKDSYLIFDEFDNIFDGGKVACISQKIGILQQFNNRLIGFTGSCLSPDEDNCLKQSFGVSCTLFPPLIKQDTQKNLKRKSIIYQDRQLWLENWSRVLKYNSQNVPVILALNKEDIKKVRDTLKNENIAYTDLTMLNNKTHFADLQTTIDQQFNQKVNSESYGVKGNWTDFPTSQEIEQNGGILVILGDIFQQRTTQQIIGRTGRLQNKGQYQYIVYMKERGHIIDFIQRQQNIMNLNMQSSNEALLTSLRQNTKDFLEFPAFFQDQKEDYKNLFFEEQEQRFHGEAFFNSQQQLINFEEKNNQILSSEEDQSDIFANDQDFKQQLKNNIHQKRIISQRKCVLNKRFPQTDINILEKHIVLDQSLNDKMENLEEKLENSQNQIQLTDQ